MNKKLIISLLLFGSVPANGMFRMLRPVAQKVMQQNSFARFTRSIKSFTPRSARPDGSSILTMKAALTPRSARPELVEGFSRLRSFSSMRNPKFFRFPKSRLVLPTALGLGSLIAGSQAYLKFKKAQSPWIAIEERYRREFAEEEKKLMEEFFKLTGITQEEWEIERAKYKSSFYTHKKIARAKKKSENHPTPTPTVVNSIKYHLKQQGINPQSIPIIRDDKGDFVAMTDQISIWVNDAYVKPESHQNWMHAVICHEIEHIKNEDYIAYKLMSKVFKKKNVPDIWKKDFLNRHSAFFEKRADILSGVKNISYAEALQCYYCSFTQPRCDYTRKLHEEMLAHAGNTTKTA